MNDILPEANLSSAPSRCQWNNSFRRIRKTIRIGPSANLPLRVNVKWRDFQILMDWERRQSDLGLLFKQFMKDELWQEENQTRKGKTSVSWAGITRARCTLLWRRNLGRPRGLPKIRRQLESKQAKEVKVCRTKYQREPYSSGYWSAHAQEDVIQSWEIASQKD